MKPDALAELRRIMRGEPPLIEPAERVAVTPHVTPETSPITRVTPVTLEMSRRGNENEEADAAADADALLDAIQERAGLAADSVPAVYLDAWARLNHQKPEGVSEARWQRALHNGGRFLDAWGREAAESGWAPDELFDAEAGLAWRLKGQPLERWMCSAVASGRTTREPARERGQLKNRNSDEL